MKQERLLIPAMLDVHFPLLKYAFQSRRFRPVLLNNRRGVTELGLRYVHNDMCYPCILNVGQMLAALGSGRFSLPETKLLMPSVGDLCRGSSYTVLLRKAVAAAGFSEVKVLTMNLKHIDDRNKLSVTPQMAWRALFAMFYGDLLLILTQQIRPYELHAGETNALRDKWYGILGADLRAFRRLTVSEMYRNFRRITEDFAAIPRRSEQRQRIGMVGDLYTKYCSLGNWDMVSYLEQNGCESYTNGLSWYVLYFIDAHLEKESAVMRQAYRLAGGIIEKMQRRMLAEIRSAGFFALPSLPELKREAAGIVSFQDVVGDGWLIGAECVGYIRHCAARKVLAVQPFGCMANHIAGRGIYASVARQAGGMIVSVDVDASGTPVSAYNRARMLIDSEAVCAAAFCNL